MSLRTNIRGSPSSMASQRLPVPPVPSPVAPPASSNLSKVSNATAAASSHLSVASGSVSQVVARRPSPPRRTGEEMTFQQKLDEIKRMRSRGNKNGENRMTTALLNQVSHSNQPFKQGKSYSIFQALRYYKLQITFIITGSAASSAAQPTANTTAEAKCSDKWKACFGYVR